MNQFCKSSGQWVLGPFAVYMVVSCARVFSARHKCSLMCTRVLHSEFNGGMHSALTDHGPQGTGGNSQDHKSPGQRLLSLVTVLMVFTVFSLLLSQELFSN